MKTKSIIIGCLCLLIFSCKKEDDFAKPITIHNGLNGIVQKGPFVSGSNVMIQELDESLNPSGKSYSTTTNDDFGSFTTESKITADIA